MSHGHVMTYVVTVRVPFLTPNQLGNSQFSTSSRGQAQFFCLDRSDCRQKDLHNKNAFPLDTKP